MEAKKAPKMIKKMFDLGELSTIDPETKYRYSLTAKCPVDGEYASVTRFEKTGHSLGRVIFKCEICSTEFEVPQSEIMVI
ncbi:hypothetical protein ABFB09_05990 [Dehalogenimonas sp. THU2]|uniref:hypothetical protein n=1 Tax=Dehalogenimonas sp. THU2 TaxID=3151121 RepID=UPI003218291E